MWCWFFSSSAPILWLLARVVYRGSVSIIMWLCESSVQLPFLIRNTMRPLVCRMFMTTRHAGQVEISLHLMMVNMSQFFKSSSYQAIMWKTRSERKCVCAPRHRTHTQAPGAPPPLRATHTVWSSRSVTLLKNSGNNGNRVSLVTTAQWSEQNRAAVVCVLLHSDLLSL